VIEFQFTHFIRHTSGWETCNLVIELNLDKRVEEKEIAAGYMGLGESIEVDE
jgi:hypothetical protein